MLLFFISDLPACSRSPMCIVCDQVNDFIRDRVSSSDGVVPHWGEILAGGCVRSTHMSFIIQYLSFSVLPSEL